MIHVIRKCNYYSGDNLLKNVINSLANSVLKIELNTDLVKRNKVYQIDNSLCTLKLFIFMLKC